MGQQCISATKSHSNNKETQSRRGISEYSTASQSSERGEDVEFEKSSRYTQGTLGTKSLEGQVLNDGEKPKKYKKNNQFNKHEHLPGVLIIGSLDIPISNNESESQSNNLMPRPIQRKDVPQFSSNSLQQTPISSKTKQQQDFQEIQPQEKGQLSLPTWRGQIMNRKTGSITYISLNFQIVAPVNIPQKVNKIAVLGHGSQKIEETQENSQEQTAKKDVKNITKTIIKYNVYGEYTDESNTQIRMDVSFCDPAFQPKNLTVVGRLCQNDTSIVGKCYFHGDRLGCGAQDIEMYKSIQC